MKQSGKSSPSSAIEAKKKSVIASERSLPTILLLFGDRVQLQQVMLNLVMNGMEAMSASRSGRGKCDHNPEH